MRGVADCLACEGTGIGWMGRGKCSDCHGSGVVRVPDDPDEFDDDGRDDPDPPCEYDGPYPDCAGEP